MPEPQEPAPVGATASIIHESRRGAEVLLGADPTRAARWMVFVLVGATISLGSWLGLRSIISFETVVGMILRSKEDQAERDRQHFSNECEKVRQHCSKETELTAQREKSRSDSAFAMFADERVKDRASVSAVRDELIALRILMGRMKIPPPDVLFHSANLLPPIAFDVVILCKQVLTRIP